MSAAVIPSFTERHILPPFASGPTALQPRSPYVVSTEDFIKRFSFSNDRVAILKGLLDYRRALHEAGFVRGFQWLAGSFVEDILRIEEREPRDIDVVTVFLPPSRYASPEAKRGILELFSATVNKPKYRCDTYPIDLSIAREGDLPSLTSLLAQANYWLGLFSHRRNSEWKGIVQVNLGTVETDETALNYLQEVGQHGH